MQTFIKKILILFSTSMALVSQLAFSQSVNITVLKQADLALRLKNYELADSLYKTYKKNNSQNIEPSIFLKLANIASIKNDYVQELIYLDSYLQKKTNEAIVDKMLEIATKNNLEGYEKDNIIFLKNIFKLVLPYFLLFFVPFCFFTLFLFFKRKIRGEVLKRRSIFALVIGILIIFVMANVENNLDEAIVINDNSILKEAPNPTVGVSQILPKGTKLNVIGSTDIWLRVLTDKVYYLKKTDVHLIQK